MESDSPWLWLIAGRVIAPAALWAMLWRGVWSLHRWLTRDERRPRGFDVLPPV